MTTDHVILATAPLRGAGLDTLRTLGEVVEEPWIDESAMRLMNEEQLAARISDLGATIVICEADRCAGPVLEQPLVAICSTRGDPTNVDIPGATAKGIPVLHAPGRNADG
ncbi:MAG: D-3-phosphoglycerate dehydrogenase / 2-oxoglutarate reductase, partial [Acidimicrobiaceae bacterium]